MDKFIIFGGQVQTIDFGDGLIELLIFLFNLFDSFEKIQFFDEVASDSFLEIFIDGVYDWDKYKLGKVDVVTADLVHEFAHTGEGAV